MGSITLKGLYAISDGAIPYDGIIPILSQTFRGGVQIFQLRDKHLSDEDLLPYAREIQALCKDNGVTFIINDRVDLAVAINADGLHIGQNDVAFDQARDRFDGIIGVSCYGDIERAQSYEVKGADYVAFGCCFPSKTKPHAPLIDLSILPQAKERLTIPICAIGGITLDNVHRLKNGQVDMVAVINALWRSDNLYKRASDFSQILEA